jgi:alpha-mannosidase
VFQDYVFLLAQDSCAIDENLQQYLTHIEVRLCDAKGKLLVGNYKKQEVTHFISKVFDQIEDHNHLISTTREKMATF